MFLMAMFRILINISLISPYLVSVQVTLHYMKVSKYEVFSGPYFAVFGLEKNSFCSLFTQCL